ncbi:MAG: PQQ-binding-like beta-propeller repeat protein [Planctomycetaceae bacterium]|nr:PQQ-binding-like beta-propeller repeat protein [Planctomycetaceae bacterium]
MLLNRTAALSVICLVLQSFPALAADEAGVWNQWRGPNRDGQVQGAPWPGTLDEETLVRRWRVELPPGYSGPVVSESAVFVAGTEDKKNEVVLALDRATGKELWRASWPGAMSVPFFAASNGSWIRATPAFDGESLYVAGMRDVLVSLNAATGGIQWRVDFAEQLETPLPAFGFASSPLLDGDFLYVQAGAAFLKLEKATGNIVWRVLSDKGGMMGSAFSSPIITTLAGKRQLVVQTRLKLAGVDPDSGDVLWEQEVPNFRGMNILTPVRFEDGIFTSSYQNKAWLYNAARADGKFEITEAWDSNTRGYMSTPVVINGHAYLHLQNQRFACIDLKTGERKWTSQPFGKYWSLVAQGDRILALDNQGKLLLIQASPEKFELIDERTVSEEETWAHLAVSNQDVFVRELKAVSAFRWEAGQKAEQSAGPKKSKPRSN